MVATLEIVLPLFGLMLAGFVTARRGLLSAEAIKGISTFVFLFAIPALLFRGLVSAGLPRIADLAIVKVYFLGALAVFGACLLIGRFVFGTGAAERALMALTATFGNVVLMGIPISYTAFGPEAVLPATLVTSFHSAILLTLTIVLVEFGRGAQGRLGRIAGDSILAVLKNPIIAAIAAGFAWAAIGGATGMRLPAPVDGFLRLLAGSATPCALFALGATLAEFRTGGDKREVAVVILIKLLALPLLVWWAAVQLFDLPPVQVAVATLLASLPSGANPFILARRYEIYVQRAATAVLVSTTLSLGTTAMLVSYFTAVK
jgi:predicted permease